jgi:uncharacterized tellurite resistance protein B-like protein
MFKWFRKQELSIRERPGDLAGACYCIAAADGELHEAEAQQLATQVQALIGESVTFDEIERLVKEAHEALAQSGLDAYLRGLGQGLSQEARSQLLGAAAAIAAADGALAKEERHVFFKLAAALDFSHEKADVILTVVTAPPPVTQRSALDDTLASRRDETDEIGAKLNAAGWTDPLASLVEAGIETEGFGAAAFQYTNEQGALLLLEHHPEAGAVHLRMTDESDVGTDLVVPYGSKLSELLAMLVAMQDEARPGEFERHAREIAGAFPEARERRAGGLVPVEILGTISAARGAAAKALEAAGRPGQRAWS